MNNHTISTLIVGALIVEYVVLVMLYFNKTSGKPLDNGIINLQLEHMLWM